MCYLLRQRDFANGIKLRTLRWRDYSGSSGVGPKCNYKHNCNYQVKEADGGLTSSREEADRMM